MTTHQEPSVLTDGELIAKFVAGDAQAFENFYRRYRDGIRRFFDYQTGSANLVNEFWRSLIHACAKGAVTGKDDLKIPVYQLAVSMLIDWYKRHGRAEAARQFQADDTAGATEGPRSVSSAQMRAQTRPMAIPARRDIFAGIGLMSEVEKAVWLVHAETDLSGAGLSRVFGRDQSVCDQWLDQARACLRDCAAHLEPVAAAE